MEAMEKADAILKEVEAMGGESLMITSTCSNKGKDLKDQIDVLQAVYRAFFKSKWRVDLLKELGYIGKISALEVMINKDKEHFHPHMHSTWAFDRKLTDEEIEKITGLFKVFWVDAMKKRKFHAAASSQDVRRANAGAGEYATKGVAAEITMGDMKTGKRGSVTWYGLLLEIYKARKEGNEEEYDRLVSLYHAYERGVYNRNFINTSPALKALSSELPEPELEEEEKGEEKEDVVVVPLAVFKAMKDLRIHHLAPTILAFDEPKRLIFKEFCDEEMGASYKWPRRNRACVYTYLKIRLREIFGDDICGKSIWDQGLSLNV